MKPIEEVELKMVESFEDVQEFFRWLGEQRDWLAWDTETTGLDPFARDAKLRLIQFGDVNTGWVFRADRYGIGVAEDVFRRYAGNMTGQNVFFDVRWFEHHSGVKVPRGKQFDTKMMGHILDPTKSTSLKAMSARFLSPSAKKLQGALDAAMRKQGWTWATVPYDFEIYTMYAALDPVLTARIATEFWSKIEVEYLDVFNLEMAAASVCSDMEVRGTLIDIEYCSKKYEEILEFTSTADKWCLDNYGIHPGQNQEVALALIRDGIDLAKTTATGDWAMDKDVLEGIDHPLAQTVLGHRKSTKIGSTYFRNFLDMHDNGVIHPSINTLGARTGRMSVQNPAVQTLPRGRIVRDAFIPRPGNLWLSVDFANIEMKLLAHFAYLTNPQATESFLEAAKSSDMHLEMAKLAFGDSEMIKGDARRQIMKNANFAKAYVAGVEKFAWTAGIELTDAANFLHLYDERFPGVKYFQNSLIDVAKKRMIADGQAWIKSPLGRKHTAEKGKEYTLVNFLVQGTAAEAFKQSLVDLDNAGFGPYMLIPVHDEQNFEIPFEHAEDLEYEIQQSMTRHEYSLPLTVSSSAASSWGEAK